MFYDFTRTTVNNVTVPNNDVQVTYIARSLAITLMLRIASQFDIVQEQQGENEPNISDIENTQSLETRHPYRRTPPSHSLAAAFRATT